MANTTIGNWKGLHIAAGEVSSIGVKIPVGSFNNATVSISRGAWPAAGADISLLASFNNGLTYEYVYLPTHIDPFIPSTKVPSPTPARVGFGWGKDRVPTHIMGRSNSATAYIADLTLEVG